MTITSFGRRSGSALLGVLLLVSTWSSPVLAQHGHTTAVAAKDQSSELVRVAREATERFKDSAVADGETTSWRSAVSAGLTTARWDCTS
jgi:hypothetical protein